jgi:urea transporter
MRLSCWGRGCASNTVLRLADACLRGAGQVVFQDHPLSGLAFLAAIAWAAWQAALPALLAGALLGLLASTAAAHVLRADEAALRRGLHGFNGLLVGVALPVFLAPTPAMALLLVLGAAASAPLMQAITRLMQRLGLPALTAPFLATTWALLLVAQALGLPAAPAAASTGAAGLDAALPGGELPARVWPLLRGLLVAPAQVFLLDDPVSGLLVLLGLALASRRALGWALLGATLASATAWAAGLDAAGLGRGVYGFSAVLTAVALGDAAPAASRRQRLAVLPAIVLTVLAQAALNAGFGGVALPALTAPFVLVTWLFLRLRAGA